LKKFDFKKLVRHALAVELPHHRPVQAADPSRYNFLVQRQHELASDQSLLETVVVLGYGGNLTISAMLRLTGCAHGLELRRASLTRPARVADSAERLSSWLQSELPSVIEKLDDYVDKSRSRVDAARTLHAAAAAELEEWYRAEGIALAVEEFWSTAARDRFIKRLRKALGAKAVKGPCVAHLWNERCMRAGEIAADELYPCAVCGKLREGRKGKLAACRHRTHRKLGLGRYRCAACFRRR
jgi:hypothetical protein